MTSNPQISREGVCLGSAGPYVVSAIRPARSGVLAEADGVVLAHAGPPRGEEQGGCETSMVAVRGSLCEGRIEAWPSSSTKARSSPNRELFGRVRGSELLLGFIDLYTQTRNFWNRAASEAKSSGCR
jgi:hypothetical protein